jgi:hypothetical protein
MKELVQRIHSLCPNEYFFVGNSLFFDTVYNFSMKCIGGVKQAPCFYNEKPEQAEERRMLRLQNCRQSLEKVIVPLFEYRSQFSYVGPDGFNPQFIEQLYEKVLNSDWTKVEATECIEAKLNELKGVAVR